MSETIPDLLARVAEEEEAAKDVPRPRYRNRRRPTIAITAPLVTPEQLAAAVTRLKRTLHQKRV